MASLKVMTISALLIGAFSAPALACSAKVRVYNGSNESVKVVTSWTQKEGRRKGKKQKEFPWKKNPRITRIAHIGEKWAADGRDDGLILKPSDAFNFSMYTVRKPKTKFRTQIRYRKGKKSFGWKPGVHQANGNFLTCREQHNIVLR